MRLVLGDSMFEGGRAGGVALGEPVGVDVGTGRGGEGGCEGRVNVAVLQGGHPWYGGAGDAVWKY